MGIGREEVRHVARLARLALSEAEEEKYATQLSHVLEHIEKLQTVDVSSVLPLAFAGDLSGSEAVAALRPDEVVPGIPREKALKAAPAHDGRAFLVPRIIE